MKENQERKPRTENQHVVGYKKNYRAQIETLQEFTSFFVEFLSKADVSPELTKKVLHHLGEFRVVFLSRGRDNKNAFFRANDQIENLMEIVKLLKESKKEFQQWKDVLSQPPKERPGLKKLMSEPSVFEK